MSDYVLSVWQAGDEPADGAAIRLCRAGEAVPLAVHAAGFDMSELRFGGAVVVPEDSLTADGLMDKPRKAAVGAALWARLTVGAIGAALGPLMGTGRIYLDLRSDGLLRLPWELLRAGNSYVFTAAGASWSIGRPEPGLYYGAGTPPAPGHPLRILVVLGNEPGDQRIRADQELLIIERQARLRNAEVMLTPLHRPSAQDIEDALKAFRPHVFHFIGHGSADSEETPQVYVNSGAGTNSEWDADRIRTVFALAPPRLVVLNACQTAHAPTEASSLVRAFIEAGCVAVVAMMGDIEGAASEHFSERFYGAIFDGAPVDAAAATARRSISSITAGVLAGDESVIQSNWALPRLTVCGDAETAVTMPYAAGRAADIWLTPDFVARWRERWGAWRAMDGGLQVDGAEARLVVLLGKKEYGKRELLRALAEVRARAGDAVIYVDLAGAETGRWWDILLRIATAAEGAGFDVADLRAAATSGGPSMSVIDEFRTVLERLRRPGDDGSLLVVLDGLSDWIDDEVNNTVLPELCAPYLRSAAGSRVRMMISLRTLPAEPPWGRRPQGWEPVEVDTFRPDEWPRAIQLFSEYWAGRAPGRRDEIVSLAEAMKNIPIPSSLQYLRVVAGYKP